MRLTGETVGIRLSVCLSVSVRQAGSLGSTLCVSTVQAICPSLASSRHVWLYGCSPESGDDPHISVEALTLC